MRLLEGLLPYEQGTEVTAGERDSLGFFEANVHYNDWKGSVAADNADMAGLGKYLEKEGLMGKDERLVAISFSYMDISDRAVATSGNYEKFIMIGGKKYSHTINPRTGLPVTGIKSVTVFSPNAEICDALATPVTIMGIGPALNLVNQLSQVECVIIDDHNKIYTSQNIKCS